MRPELTGGILFDQCRCRSRRGNAKDAKAPRCVLIDDRAEEQDGAFADPLVRSPVKSLLALDALRVVEHGDDFTNGGSRHESSLK